jgi:hypothetical protein
LATLIPQAILAAINRKKKANPTKKGVPSSFTKYISKAPAPLTVY